MCLRISRRKTTSAGVPCRPRLRLLGRRFPKASYTAATSSSSANTWSAYLIQSSQRSSTSAAINPSPKLSCARRILITDFAPALRRGPFRTQQLVVELANDLDRLLQFLIIAQPAAHLGNPLAAQEGGQDRRLGYEPLTETAIVPDVIGNGGGYAHSSAPRSSSAT